MKTQPSDSSLSRPPSVAEKYKASRPISGYFSLGSQIIKEGIIGYREANIKKQDGKDQNGEYLREVWEKDLEKRKARTRSNDSQLNDEELETVLKMNTDESEERFCELE